jgi:type IV secretion system protein VirB10
VIVRVLTFAILGSAALTAQPPAAQVPDAGAQPSNYTVGVGTKIPLTLINSVSTKHSAVGDHVYLQTAFPVLVNGRIVIPVGSYVAGSVTQIKKPGRVKGRGELYVRFESLTLPNGVTRDFHSRIGSMDGTAAGKVNPAEGKVQSDGNKGGDAVTVAQTAEAGATVGAVAGSVAHHTAMGIGIGAGAGAAAGLIGVLASRGPDAILARGSTVEMILDRDLNYTSTELAGNSQFAGSMPPPPPEVAPPAPNRRILR